MIHSRDLACQWPGGRTLRFADVDLPAGGTLLLRGPSGSGKSSWLALVAGLRAASGGRLSVAGTEVGDMAPVARDAWRARTIGFLPQKLLLSEALNVAHNLALVYMAVGRPVDRERIAQTLDALGVAALASRRPSQLSGGEAQRVALARAVIVRPDVLLLDEPTANLDPYNIGLIETVLRGINRERGTTMILVTHNIFQARRLADRVGLLLGGRLVEVAPTQVFMENPVDPRTRAFVNGEMVY